MKRLRLRVSNLLKVSVLALIFSVFLQASNSHAAEISTVSELLAITGSGDYVLTINLDLSTAVATTEAEAIQLAGVGDNVYYAESPVLNDDVQVLGSTTYISEAFTGRLDGGEFTILGLTKPLFDVISQAPDTIDADGNEIDTVEVKNLILESSTFVDGNGALANVSLGTIDNVSSSANVIGLADGSETLIGVGGLVGRSEGTITNSDVTGTVGGDVFVGGLVGYSSGTISNSSATGAVTGDDDDGANNVGGLVGYSSGAITNSSATGAVIGDDDVGGLVGTSEGAITNSYAAGAVTGYNDVGGLVGYSEGAINNSYAIGAVIGDNNVGGLVGISDGAITNSYAIGAVTGDDEVGGLVGHSDGAITTSYATGDVIGSGEYIGGLVGASYATIRNSYATGNVNEPDGDGGLVGYEVGGLVGYLGGTLDNTYATGDVSGHYSVGGLVGETGNPAVAAISDSYAEGSVDGVNNVGGLVGYSDISITNSYATGAVTGDDDVGGLVGVSEGDISNSYAVGDVTGLGEYIGGLVGWLKVGATILNSYASTGTVTGTPTNVDAHGIGGLVGYSSGTILESHANGNVIGFAEVGGLVGSSGFSTAISNSYATGDVTGSGGKIGGLVGLLDGLPDESHIIFLSYATGNVIGFAEVGGLVGSTGSSTIISNSYATGDVTGNVDVGSLIGLPSGGAIESFGYGEATTIGGDPIVGDPYLRVGEAPNILTIVNTAVFTLGAAFEVNASINGGRPYLISLEDSYDVAETPSYSLRSYYTQAAKSLDKALTSFGFKSNFSAHPTLGFQALDQNQSNSPAAIQLFEVSEYQNSNILLSKEDGLQLSISSYYKESVEIWTQGSNGEYLYLGLVEFDKDGKVILPTLKFDTANTYQLLMIKAADKLSEKPNLEAKVGQININVF